MEPVEEKNYFQENVSHGLKLLGLTFYLIFSIIYFKSTNTMKVTINPNASESRKKMYGDGSCNFDCNSHIEALLIASFVPTLFMRLFAFIKFRHRDPHEIEEMAKKIMLYWQLSYGFWTLIEFIEYMFISPNCREILAMSLLSYQIALIIGCYCCINFLFIAIVVILLIPYLLYRFVFHFVKKSKKRRN